MWEKNDIREILISENEIQERAKQLGEQITKDYSSKKPLLVGLLRGSVPFLADLMKNIDLDDANRFELIKWLKSFLDNYKPNAGMRGLYLTGNFGCGKTYLI